MVPENLRYTKEHEWIKVDGEDAVVGITDHAQSELGDITFVELPGSGNDVKKHDSVATIESVKAASDVYSPLSGRITEVNSLLEDSPETLNASPYGDGWIYKLKISDITEKDDLLDAESYKKIIGE